MELKLQRWEEIFPKINYQLLIGQIVLGMEEWHALKIKKTLAILLKQRQMDKHNPRQIDFEYAKHVIDKFFSVHEQWLQEQNLSHNLHASTSKSLTTSNGLTSSFSNFPPDCS